MHRVTSRPLSGLLGFIAGFVDTAGFMGVFGLFTAHITGNLATLGATLLRGSGGELAKLLAIPVYVLAVALVRLFVAWFERTGADWLRPVAVLHMLLLAAFMTAGLAWSPFAGQSDWHAIAAGLFGVAAMGVQSAMTKLDSLTQTTAMTGNTTQIVLDLVELAVAHGDAEARRRLGRTWPAVSGFVAGAACGGIGFGLYGFVSLAIPVALSLLLVIVPRRDAAAISAYDARSGRPAAHSEMP